MINFLIRFVTQRVLRRIIGGPHPAEVVGALAAVILFNLVRLGRRTLPLDELEFTCDAIEKYIEKGEALAREIPRYPRVGRIHLTENLPESLSRFQTQSQQLYDDVLEIIEALEAYLQNGERIMRDFQLARLTLDKYPDPKGKLGAYFTKIALAESRLAETEEKLAKFHFTLQTLRRTKKRYEALIGAD